MNEIQKTVIYAVVIIMIVGLATAAFAQDFNAIPSYSDHESMDEITHIKLRWGTVATVGDLPPASGKAGQVWFVTSTAASYYSDGTNWIRFPAAGGSNIMENILVVTNNAPTAVIASASYIITDTTTVGGVSYYYDAQGYLNQALTEAGNSIEGGGNVVFYGHIVCPTGVVCASPGVGLHGYLNPQTSTLYRGFHSRDQLDGVVRLGRESLIQQDNTFANFGINGMKSVYTASNNHGITNNISDGSGRGGIESHFQTLDIYDCAGAGIRLTQQNTHCKYYDLDLHNNTGDGMYTSGESNAHVALCWFDSNGGDGFHGNVFLDSLIQNNNSIGNTGHGIYAQNSDHVQIIANQITNVSRGIYATDCLHSTISLNKIKSTSWHGIDIIGSFVHVSENRIWQAGKDGIYGFTSHNSKIENNLITDAVEDGIHLDTTIDAEVNNNTIIDPGARGIFQAANFTRLRITGNTVVNWTSQNAIKAEDFNNGLISNNHLEDFPENGIGIEAGGNVSVFYTEFITIANNVMVDEDEGYETGIRLNGQNTGVRKGMNQVVLSNNQMLGRIVVDVSAHTSVQYAEIDTVVHGGNSDVIVKLAAGDGVQMIAPATGVIECASLAAGEWSPYVQSASFGILYKDQTGTCYDTGLIGSGGGGGSSTFDGLTDTSITSADDNDLVTYSAGVLVDTDAPTIDQLNFDVNAAETLTTAGQVAWDSTEGMLKMALDDGSVVKVPETLVLHIRNTSGITLTKGTLIESSGTTGPVIDATPYTSTSTGDPRGLVLADIANNATGYAVVEGLIEGVDTSSFTQDDELYPSTSTLGGLQNTLPAYGNNRTIIGFVQRSHATQGQIEVHMDHPRDMGENKNADNTGITTNSIWKYDGTKWAIGTDNTGGGSGGGNFEILVAASNASQAEIDAASYTCNGTNDVAQIEAAINDIGNRFRGGIVRLSGGTFFVDSTIDFATSFVRLNGMGIHQTRMLLRANTDMFNLSSGVQQHNEIGYMELDGNDATYTTSGNEGIVDGVNAIDDYKIHWIYAHDFAGAAVRMDNASNDRGVIQNSRFSACGINNAYFSNQNGAVIENCLIDNGQEMYVTGRTIVSHCTFLDQSDSGLQLGNYVNVNDCYFYNTTTYSIYINSSHNEVHGCKIYNNLGSRSIFVFGSYNNLSGCRDHDSSGDSYYIGGDYNNLSGMYSYSAAGDAFEFSSARQNELNGFYAYDPTQSGLEISVSSQNNFNGGYIYSAGNPSILVYNYRNTLQNIYIYDVTTIGIETYFVNTSDNILKDITLYDTTGTDTAIEDDGDNTEMSGITFLGSWGTTINSTGAGTLYHGQVNSTTAPQFSEGVVIGADSTNNLIDDESNGASSSTLYIGNLTITTAFTGSHFYIPSATLIQIVQNQGLGSVLGAAVSLNNQLELVPTQGLQDPTCIGIFWGIPKWEDSKGNQHVVASASRVPKIVPQSEALETVEIIEQTDTVLAENVVCSSNEFGDVVCATEIVYATSIVGTEQRLRPGYHHYQPRDVYFQWEIADSVRAENPLQRARPQDYARAVASVGDSWEPHDKTPLLGAWVSTANGIVENGDFLMPGPQAGWLVRQPDDVKHTYTVGQARERITANTKNAYISLMK